MILSLFITMNVQAQLIKPSIVQEVSNPPPGVVEEFERVQTLCDEKEAKSICDHGAFFFSIEYNHTGSIFFNRYTGGGWLMLQTEFYGNLNITSVLEAGLNLGLAYIPMTGTGPRLTYGAHAQVNVTRWLYVKGSYYTYKLPEIYSQWQTNWRSIEVGVNRAAGNTLGFRYQWNGSGISTYGISSRISLKN